MTTLKFDPQQGWGQILTEWWRSLNDDTGGRAALRRAPDITAVVMLPAFQRLHRRLMSAGWPSQRWQDDRLAAVAGLLAHVREQTSLNLPRSMSDGEAPALSELRFRRLLESPDVDALFSGLRRALPLLQDRADICALATDVVNWGDEVKKRWAYAYAWPVKSRA
jgi:CRISPR system Cascade subunit CasB